jgi:phosphoglucomutase
MSEEKLLTKVQKKANQWLEGNYDSKTKEQVKHLLEHDEKELIESFYRDLEFGTGGLRGIMGVGTNRMNIYTVGGATQGLSNYILSKFGHLPEIKVAVAHDSRNNSRLFAETTAEIFAANGFKVYLFKDLRPTPELSFAIRHFGCQSGVVVTASHNPKEYNGYKAYWDDGGQVIYPHDKNIIKEVLNIKSIKDIKFKGNKKNITLIGKEIDEIYLNKIKDNSLSPEVIKNQNDLKIVYTPIHGTGVTLVPKALRNLGFTNIYNVPEQDVVSGDFPTVHSPNPEETAALKMAIEKAEEVDADIVMATDPDADRVGVATKDNKGKFIILNGNQTASLLTHYLLKKWSENGKLTGKEYVVKTIVTSELLIDMANKFKVESFDVLTGFKYIADIIHKNEDKKIFIGGGEESYGFMVGDAVRDKDAVSACSMVAEIAAYAKDQGKSLFELLLSIYEEYGYYLEDLISVVKKGKEGEEEIEKMMADFRATPPQTINGSQVVRISDYQSRETIDKTTGEKISIKLPKSNVLQFLTADGSKISVRPSGTEPKIKFYFSVREPINSASEYDKATTLLKNRIESIKKDLKLV